MRNKSFYLADICAIIVSYNCSDVIIHNVNSLIEQVPKIIILDNNSDKEAKKILFQLEHYDRCSVIYFDENLGIGTRLNEGIAIADNLGYSLLLTMDQDTILDTNCVKNMISVINSNRDIVSVGPNRNGRYSNKGFFYKSYLITSGNLVLINALKAVDGYDETFFVDMIDIDISLKLRAANFRLAVSEYAYMDHNVGETEENNIWGIKLKYRSHNVKRFFYIYRNLVIIEKRYFRLFPGFCIKLALTHCKDFIKIILEKNAKSKYKEAINGLKNGNNYSN